MKKLLLFILLVCGVQVKAQCTASPTLNISGAFIDSAKCGQATGGVSGISAANVTGGSAPYNFIWTSNGNIVGTSPSLSNVGVGVYSLQVIDNVGCNAVVVGGSSTFTIPASAQVVASFTTNPSPATGNIPLTINFTCTSTGASFYNWSFGDGASASNASTSHTYTTTGTYGVLLFCGNATCHDTAFIMVTANVAGIEEISNTNLQADVNPNPSNGIFTIETNVAEKQMVFIFDVNGKLVFNQFINGKAGIDARSLNAGVYSLNITSNHGSVTKKLVIVK
jgi:hypothetical protein